METLERILKRHEGLRLNPYKDSLGNQTIGYGHLIKGEHLIDEDIAEMLLRRDMDCAVRNFYSLPLEVRGELNISRRRVLVSMIFNLGVTSFLGFKKMLKALEESDYTTAADEMLDSLWARQVGRRAEELAKIMRQGE